jgi:cytochrome b561
MTNMQDQSTHPAKSSLADRCYAFSRLIHWVTVALVSAVLVTALFEDIDPHGAGNAAFLWHSSMGLAVYLLTLTRVLLWFVYRPATRVVRATRAFRGLRFSFYALLIALPVSGWWLASEEGMPAHLFGIPALPQWYQQQDAPREETSAARIVRAESVPDTPVVRLLAKVHAGLGAALALVIVLHLFSTIGDRVRRNDG